MHVSRKIIFAKAPDRTYALDSIALLFGDGDSLGSRGQGRIVIAVLAKQTQELLRVLCDEVGELRIAGAKLLENGLQHLRLLLDDLTELLKLGVVAQKVEVAEALALLGSSDGRSRSRSGGSSRSATRSGSCSARATTSLLRGKIEQVDIAIVVDARGRGRSRGRI